MCACSLPHKTLCTWGSKYTKDWSDSHTTYCKKTACRFFASEDFNFKLCILKIFSTVLYCYFQRLVYLLGYLCSYYRQTVREPVNCSQYQYHIYCDSTISIDFSILKIFFDYVYGVTSIHFFSFYCC